MHAIKTLARLNREAAEADAILKKHEVPCTEGERDFLIGYHSGVAILTPLKTKAVQWAYANIKNHLGREGIAYVVDRGEGIALEQRIRAEGFRVN